MSSISKLSALCLTTILCACTITDVTRPDLQTAEPLNWSAYLETVSDISNGISNDEAVSAWWELFGDETLNALIHTGVEGNLDVAMARARVRESRALMDAEIAGFKPRIGVSGAAEAQHLSENGSLPVGSIPGFNVDQVVYNAGFDAAWELDVFGRNSRKEEIAIARLQSVEETRCDLTIALIGEISRNYFELRGAQLEQKNIGGIVSGQAEIVETVSVKRQYGEASDFDVERASAQLAEFEILMPPLEARIRGSIYRLSVLTGQAPDTLTTQLMMQTPLPAMPALHMTGVTSDLLRRRADVRRAERQYVISAKQVELSDLSYYPTFSLFGGVGPNSTDLTDILDLKSIAANVGAMASWTFYDNGVRDAQNEAALARLDQARLAYRQSVLGALEDVETSTLRFTQSVREWNLQQSVEGLRVRIAKLARARYDGGSGPLLDVLQTELDVSNARVKTAKLQTQNLVHLVSFYKALGGGWAVFEDGE